MKNGTVRKILNERAFGFIEDSEGNSYFFHKNDLIAPVFYELKEMDSVQFEPGESPKGKVATRVRKIEPKEEVKTETQNSES